MTILVIVLLILCMTLILLLVWAFYRISVQSWEMLALRAAIDAGREKDGKLLGQSGWPSI